MEQKNSKTTFVVCIKNEGYVASLELRKIYEVTYLMNVLLNI